MGCAQSVANRDAEKEKESEGENIPLEPLPADNKDSENLNSNPEKGQSHVVANCWKGLVACVGGIGPYLKNDLPKNLLACVGGIRPYLKKNWRNVLACACLWMAYFMANVAFSIIAPFFPLEVEEKKGYSPIITGLMISCAPLCVVIFSPVFGFLLPYIGFRIMISVGLLAIGTSYLLLAFVDLLPANWVFVVVTVSLRLVEGVGTALLFTATFTILPVLFPNSVATLMGLFEVSSGVGYALGPPLGGVLYQYGGFKAPFITVGVSVFLFIIPCTLLVKAGTKKSENSRFMFKIFLKSLTDLPFILLVSASTLCLTGIAFFSPTLQPFLFEQFNLNFVQVGLVLFISPAIYLISALITGPFSDTYGTRWFIVVGFFGFGIGFIFLGPAEFISAPNLRITCFALAFIGIAGGIGNIPIFADMLTIAKRELDSDDEDDILTLTALVSGVLAASISLGQFLGPLVGGALTEALSFATSSLLIGEVVLAEVALLMGVTIIDIYTSREKKSP